jgi:hypothetical protein
MKRGKEAVQGQAIEGRQRGDEPPSFPLLLHNITIFTIFITADYAHVITSATFANLTAISGLTAPAHAAICSCCARVVAAFSSNTITSRVLACHALQLFHYHTSAITTAFATNGCLGALFRQHLQAAISLY